MKHIYNSFLLLVLKYELSCLVMYCFSTVGFPGFSVFSNRCIRKLHMSWVLHFFFPAFIFPSIFFSAFCFLNCHMLCSCVFFLSPMQLLSSELSCYHCMISNVQCPFSSCKTSDKNWRKLSVIDMMMCIPAETGGVRVRWCNCQERMRYKEVNHHITLQLSFSASSVQLQQIQWRLPLLLQKILMNFWAWSFQIWSPFPWWLSVELWKCMTTN